jgi:signal transduction histidine kinase/streptogramin lyase
VHRDADGAFRTERATTVTGLLTDGVISLLEDRDGNIWAGTTEGLNRLTPYKLTPVSLGLTDGVEVTPEGSVWIASVNGLIEFPDAHIDSQRQPARLPRSRATAMHADRNGTLWAAMNGWLQPIAGRTPSVRLDRARLPRRVASIASNVRGDLVLYDLDQGLVRVTKGRIEAITLPLQLQRVAIVATYGDKRGRVWLGFADGQVALVDADGAVRTFDKGSGLNAGIYYVIYEDDEGVVWGGGSNGISRCVNDICATLLAGKEFPVELVTAIVQDDSRALWLGTRFGIVRVEPDQIEKAIAEPSYQPQYTLFDRSDGLGGMPVTTGLNRRAIRADDGVLWFVTRRGVTLVDPVLLRNTPGSSPVHIESITADGQQLAPEEGARLPPRTSRLVIDYGMLNLTPQIKTRFQYRLDGFDSMWTDAGAERQAVYTNLPPGRYRFRVMASSEGNRWTKSAVAWDFSISPMFYQTVWFYGACVMAGAVAVWTAWRFHLRQIRREFSLLLKERARLSRELHDTLLQNLVGVALQCEAMAREPGMLAASGKDRFIRMRKEVGEHIREARQSIWDLRSPTLESRDLERALRHVARHASERHSVAVQVSVHGAPCGCTPKVQEQLLRIGQEAVVNAVRHGRADRVNMELQYAATSVSLRVSDNGCGFDPDRVTRHPNGHCGLISMKERAADIGGTLTIESHVARGTTIETRVPISSRS